MSVVRADPNGKYLPLSQITDMGGPPAMGFFEAIASSFEATTVAMNPYSFERSFQELEDENIRKLAEAGVDVKPLDYVGEGPFGHDLRMSDTSRYASYRPYTDFQRAAYDANAFSARSEGRGAEYAARRRAREITKARDEQIAKAQAARPDLGILTYEQMRRRVAEEGRKTYDAWANSRGSLGANLGGFVGEMFGNLDPRTNPMWVLNFAGGAVGKTALFRTMSQYGFGAGTEALQQLTGTAETMKWFGVEPSVGQRLLSIGLAGVLPAAAQGLGEFIGHRALRARRVAQPPPAAAPAPAPPLPATPPARTVPMAPAMTAVTERMRTVPPEREVMDALGLTAMERPRFADDVDHTARSADIFGTSPGDVPPPTARLDEGASVIPNYRSWLGPGAADMNVELPATWRPRGSDISIEDVARGEWGAGRAVDPEVFARIDKLSTQIVQVREQLRVAQALEVERSRLRKGGDRPETQRLMDRQIEAGGRIRSQSGVARVAKETEVLRRMQEEGGPVPARFDPQRIAAQLAKLEEERRGLTPLADRALARAQGSWESLGQELPVAWRDAVTAADAKRNAPVAPKWLGNPKTVKQLTEIEPDFVELYHRAALEGGKRNEPKIDTIQRVLDAKIQEAPEVNEGQLGVLTKLSDEAAEAKRNPPTEPPEPDALDAHRERLEALGDRMIEIDDKPLSVREFLQQAKEEADAYQQATSCMIMMGWSSGQS